MARFKIYYDDGSTYTDGDEGAPPSYGVICILQRRGDDTRYHIVSGTPYYIFVDDEWIPAWMNDIEDRLAHIRESIKGFIVGRLVSKKQFNRVYEQAKIDRAKETLHND